MLAPDYRNDEILKLTPVAIEPWAEPLPPRVATFLEDAEARISTFLDEHEHAQKVGFFPSDYELAYRILRALRGVDRQARTFCEWGSGFGVVAGLAASLGYEACGIEIDRRLIRASRKLLADYQLPVEILEGSFVPDEYSEDEDESDCDTRTVMSGARGNDEVDVEIRDFDVVFAFPWPTEEELFCDMFARFAAVGSLLITFQFSEGAKVRRACQRQ